MNPSFAMPDLPCDFAEFLAQKRQTSTEAASNLIGEWLVRYESGPVARSHAAKSNELAVQPAAGSLPSSAPRLRKVA